MFSTLEKLYSLPCCSPPLLSLFSFSRNLVAAMVAGSRMRHQSSPMLRALLGQPTSCTAAIENQFFSEPAVYDTHQRQDQDDLVTKQSGLMRRLPRALQTRLPANETTFGTTARTPPCFLLFPASCAAPSRQQRVAAFATTCTSYCTHCTICFSCPRSSSLGSSGNVSGGGGGGGGKGRKRPTGPLDMRALSFVCCTLAGLPYQVQEEPLFIVDYVNRQVCASGDGGVVVFCRLVCTRDRVFVLVLVFVFQDVCGRGCVCVHEREDNLHIDSAVQCSAFASCREGLRGRQFAHTLRVLVKVRCLPLSLLCDFLVC